MRVVYIILHILGSVYVKKYIRHLKKINVFGLKLLYSFIVKV